MATADELEEQIGVAVRVGEVADLVDHQERGAGVVAQAAAQRGVGVERGELAQELAGGGEEHGVPAQHRLVGDVLRDGGLAEPGGADQQGVGGGLEEAERHQLCDGGLVALLGPAPVEVGQRLEAADVRAAQPALE